MCVFVIHASQLRLECTAALEQGQQTQLNVFVKIFPYRKLNMFAVLLEVFHWERNVDILSVFSSLARSSREKSVSSVVSCGSGAEMKTSASFISGREISSLLWTRVGGGGAVVCGGDSEDGPLL